MSVDGNAVLPTTYRRPLHALDGRERLLDRVARAVSAEEEIRADQLIQVALRVAEMTSLA
jgi:hypothetical protein